MRRRRLRYLCQGNWDCHCTLSGKTDGRTERASERGKKEFKKWRSQSCEKKVSPSASCPSVLRCRLSVGPPAARRPLLVNSFPNVQIPRLSVVRSGVFPSPSRTELSTSVIRDTFIEENKSKKEIYNAVPKGHFLPAFYSQFRGVPYERYCM